MSVVSGCGLPSCSTHTVCSFGRHCTQGKLISVHGLYSTATTMATCQILHNLKAKIYYERIVPMLTLSRGKEDL